MAGTKNSITAENAVNADVILYAADGNKYNYTGYTMTSDADAYTPIDEGIYKLSDQGYDNISKGKYHEINKRWFLNDGGVCNTLDCALNNNIGSNKGKSQKTEIFIHNTCYNNRIGVKTSTGCLLITDEDWDDFNSKMKEGSGTMITIVNRKGSDHNPILGYAKESTVLPIKVQYNLLKPDALQIAPNPYRLIKK